MKISGLGEAINAAVAAATLAEHEGIAKITKVETQYPDMPSGRGCAQILIHLERKTPGSPKRGAASPKNKK